MFARLWAQLRFCGIASAMTSRKRSACLAKTKCVCFPHIVMYVGWFDLSQLRVCESAAKVVFRFC